MVGTANDPTSDWRDGARRLWGDDWIVPLSEVMGIDRHLVARWASGETPIAPEIANQIIALADAAHPHTSGVGQIARLIANGHNVGDWLNHYERLRRHYPAILTQSDDKTRDA